MPTVSADHTYYIDLTDDPGFATFTSHYPEQLSFDDKIKGPGNCSWQISFSAKDQDGATVVTPVTGPSYTPFIGPFRNYFRLRFGNVAIMAGPITDTDTKSGQDFVSVTGKTWETYLERWQYPFDPRVTPSDAVDHTQDFQYSNSLMGNESTPGSGRPLGGSGYAYECYQRDIIKIISDVLGTTMLNVPYRHTFDITSLTGLSGIHANYQLSLGDSTYMDSMINSLAAIGQGIDWWISWDQVFMWATPYRFGDPGNPTLAYTIDNTTPGILEGGIGFHNSGPAATHVIGKGAGFATQTTMMRAYGYPPGQAQFSRLDKSYDFGDFRHKAALVDRTQRQLSLDLQPQHQAPVQLDPGQIPGFWSTFRKGRAIWITYDLTSNRIDSLWQVMGYSAKDENNSGNVLVDLQLEQRYDLDWSVGTPEG